MLRSCFLSNFFESRSAVSEEKSKMSQPIMGHGGHLFFTDRPEKHRLGKGRLDLVSCQRRNQKCLSQSKAGAAILFFRSAQKTQTWKKRLRSCFLSSFVEFRSAVSEKKSKMSQPIRARGGHLVFLIDLKNTNLLEGFEILLPVKFRSIPFSGFRGEVENVSANQRPGRPSCFFRSARKTQTW